jgi:hypothetical protein
MAARSTAASSSTTTAAFALNGCEDDLKLKQDSILALVEANNWPDAKTAYDDIDKLTILRDTLKTKIAKLSSENNDFQATIAKAAHIQTELAHIIDRHDASTKQSLNDLAELAAISKANLVQSLLNKDHSRGSELMMLAATANSNYSAFSLSADEERKPLASLISQVVDISEHL